MSIEKFKEMLDKQRLVDQVVRSQKMSRHEVAEVLVGVGDSVEAHQVVVVLAAHPNDAIDVEEGDSR